MSLFAREKPPTVDPMPIGALPCLCRGRVVRLEQYKSSVHGTYWIGLYLGGMFLSVERGFVGDQSVRWQSALELRDAIDAYFRAGDEPTNGTANGSVVAVTDEAPSVPAALPEPDDTSGPLVDTSGLDFERRFSGDTRDPTDCVNWSLRTAEIPGKDGAFVFRQTNVAAPCDWTDRAVNVVTSKYLWGDQTKGCDPAVGGREWGIPLLVNRVALAITSAGRRQNVFASDDAAERFRCELIAMFVQQRGSMNSPVWFNVGLAEAYGVQGSEQGWAWDDAMSTAVPCRDAYARPQGSACFIQSVNDDMASIMALATSEAMLFKYGSGSGTDLSTIRSSRESVKGGGTASGPVSFMEGYDAFANVIKSGGVTRRSAKMQTLKVWHPDIRRFVTAKRDEDRKARDLIRAGWPETMTGHHAEAYSSVKFQNANLTVRVTDEFLNAAATPDGTYALRAVTTGEVLEEVNASGLLDEIASAAWECGDPGLQYEDTIQRWHTCPNTAPINSSNPCCFVGNTLIATSVGKVSIARLADMDAAGETLPDALAFDCENGQVVTRKITRAWASGSTRRLVDVTTESGLAFRCTPAHEYLTLDSRQYVEIGQMAPGTRLRTVPMPSCPLDTFNDRLERVEPAPAATDDTTVYDLEVEGVHNFVVTSADSDHGIVVSNSEYMFIDDSACNLLSLNLLKFRTADGTFDIPGFRHAVRVAITAQEILVDHASYPTEAICRNSHNFRPLGLGYANLGAYLMVSGIPYDSVAGREFAGAVTALMHAEAYRTSAEIAVRRGPFAGFAANQFPMLAVVTMHLNAADNLYRDCELDTDAERIVQEAGRVMAEALDMGEVSGFRNSQTSVLAPTGTIAFMMDCDTTGVEPATALVSYKSLAGGGSITMELRCIEESLRNLGYRDEPSYLDDRDHSLGVIVPSVLKDGVEWVRDHGTVEGWPYLDPTHLPVFDSAFPAQPGGRCLSWRAHVAMMAAVQPFISGSISKCITGDSLVTTDRGLVRIGSLYEGEQPDTFRHDIGMEVAAGDGSRCEARDFYYGGVRPTWKATLADGRTITGTEPHRVRVAAPDGLDWKTIPDLQPGDFVGVCLGAEMWGDGDLPTVTLSDSYGCQNEIRVPNRVDTDLALFLGMLSADGHITQSNYTVGFTKDDLSARAKFKSLLSTLFGLDGHDVRDVRRGGGSDGFTGVTVGSKSLMEWLVGIGWSKDHIPDCVLCGPRRAALAYLSGLYLDGYITKQHDVAISQLRWSILLDAQSLWDNLGVATYFTDNIIDGINYRVLHALGSDRRKMADMIDWIEPHKAARAIAVEAGQDRRLFPFPFHREALLSAVRETHQTQQYRSLFDPRTSTLRRKTFLEAADAIGLDLMEEEKNLHYVPVISVEYAGEQAVFDLSVPGPESFVANGIVNHNTVNLSSDATVADIREAYMEAWRAGLKSLAIYRDGSKGVQPLTTGRQTDAADVAHAPDDDEWFVPAVATDTGDVEWRAVPPSRDMIGMFVASPPSRLTDAIGLAARALEIAPAGPLRHEPLPATRASLCHKFVVEGRYEFYVHVGFYEDGRVGEVWLDSTKEGSTLGGMFASFGVAVSMGLQRGIPLEAFVRKFAHTRFEPHGFTDNPADVPICKSPIDYVARWLGVKFVPGYRDEFAPTLDPVPAADAERVAIVPPVLPAPLLSPPVMPSPVAGNGVAASLNGVRRLADAPTCDVCGSLTTPCGNCYRCPTCGQSMGCS